MNDLSKIKNPNFDRAINLIEDRGGIKNLTQEDLSKLSTYASDVVAAANIYLQSHNYMIYSTCLQISERTINYNISSPMQLGFAKDQRFILYINPIALFVTCKDLKDCVGLLSRLMLMILYNQVSMIVGQVKRYQAESNPNLRNKITTGSDMFLIQQEFLDDTLGDMLPKVNDNYLKYVKDDKALDDPLFPTKNIILFNKLELNKSSVYYINGLIQQDDNDCKDGSCNNQSMIEMPNQNTMQQQNQKQQQERKEQDQEDQQDQQDQNQQNQQNQNNQDDQKQGDNNSDDNQQDNQQSQNQQDQNNQQNQNDQQQDQQDQNNQQQQSQCPNPQSQGSNGQQSQQQSSSSSSQSNGSQQGQQQNSNNQQQSNQQGQGQGSSSDSDGDQQDQNDGDGQQGDGQSDSQQQPFKRDQLNNDQTNNNNQSNNSGNSENGGFSDKSFEPQQQPEKTDPVEKDWQVVGQPTENNGTNYQPFNNEAINFSQANGSQMNDSHALNMMQVDPGQLKSAEKAMAQEALKQTKSRGYSGGQWEELIEADTRPSVINWKKLLMRRASVTSPFRTNTFSRINRRFPKRLEMPGRKQLRIPRIFIAVDTSGSISTKELIDAFSEIKSISRNVKAELIFIQNDSEITAAIPIEKEKDIDKCAALGRGGTAFYPVFNFIRQYDGYDPKTSILVFITDGYGEDIDEFKDNLTGYPLQNTIWLISDVDKDDIEQARENLSLYPEQPGIILPFNVDDKY